MMRRQFSREFKKEAVQLVIKTGSDKHEFPNDFTGVFCFLFYASVFQGTLDHLSRNVVRPRSATLEPANS